MTYLQCVNFPSPMGIADLQHRYRKQEGQEGRNCWRTTVSASFILCHLCAPALLVCSEWFIQPLPQCQHWPSRPGQRPTEKVQSAWPGFFLLTLLTSEGAGSLVTEHINLGLNSPSFGFARLLNHQLSCQQAAVSTFMIDQGEICISLVP